MFGSIRQPSYTEHGSPYESEEVAHTRRRDVVKNKKKGCIYFARRSSPLSYQPSLQFELNVCAWSGLEVPEVGELNSTSGTYCCILMALQQEQQLSHYHDLGSPRNDQAGTP